LLTAPILALDAVGPFTPTVLNKSADDPIDGQPPLSMPEVCPVTLDELLSDDRDP
jgi:hypothetical protein